jgi:hypothetical protein
MSMELELEEYQANQIKALRAENKKLRDALGEITRTIGADSTLYFSNPLKRKLWEIARAALKETQTDETTI